MTPNGVLDPGWVEVDGGGIVGLGHGRPPRLPAVDLGARWLTPGFVDLHAHGGGGATFQSGDTNEVERARRFHLEHGTTTSVASLVTAPIDELVAACHILAMLARRGLLGGIHLEGPFLSRTRAGAHDPAGLRIPVADEVDRLLAAADGTPLIITLAPELECGIEAVARIAAHGAVAAIGHTDATAEVTAAAIDAGARLGTHLFNGMAPIHHRTPGPVPGLLADARVTVELIADGVHLHPALLRFVFAAVGAGRVALVTDATPAAGRGDGEFVIGRMPVRVVDGVARLADGTSIAGSTITLDTAVRTTVAAGVPFDDAIRSATETPARVLGLGDRIGRIAAGADADLVVLDDDLTVRRVMSKGRWVS